jgi:predicted nucleic acid-binding protein
MADYYADSSVLVKRHVNEIGSDWFRALADPASGNAIITLRVSIIEVYSAFNRRVREAGLSPVDYTQLATDFASIYGAEYQIVELTVAVADRARVLLENHALRAYDGIQL